MIDQLVALGESLEKKWNRKDFPGLATDALSELEFPFSLKEFESAVAQWTLQLEKLPKQVNLYNVFGEPAMTLFNNGKFAVDIYFWRKNDTLIHSHGFRGAFRVLYGQSLHEEFEIKTTEEIEKDLVCSQVSHSKIEILNKGEIRTILPGMDLVHRVLHLDNPTVTLCLRTVEDVELSQWHHLSTGISYKQCNMDEIVIKRILYFQFAYRSNPALAEAYLEQMLDQMDVSSQLGLYESLFQNEFGLEYEVSCIIIDAIRVRFIESKWFALYEEHYKKIGQDLLEFQASKGPLKVLAHAINCNYSKEDTLRLLKSFSKDHPEELCQQLLGEKSVFLEECREGQIKTIKEYAKDF